MIRKKNLLLTTLTLLLAAVLVTTYGLGRLDAQVAQPAGPTSVAVLNVQEVLAELDQAAAFTQELQATQTTNQAELKDLQDEVQSLQSDLDLAADDQKDALQEQILDKIIAFNITRESQNQRLVLDQRRHLASLYLKVVAMGETIAQRRGFDIVVLDTPMPDFQNLNPEQVLNAIATRKVLYHSDAVDLSRGVVEQLNTDWANR